MENLSDEKQFLNSFFDNYFGFLLELGPGDGKTNSMTGDLMSRGWSGTFVEKSCYYMKDLNKLYNNDKNDLYNLVVSNKWEQYYSSDENLPEKVIKDFDIEKVDDKDVPIYLYYNTIQMLFKMFIISRFDLIVINFKNSGFCLKNLGKNLDHSRMIVVRNTTDSLERKEISNILLNFKLVKETNNYLFYKNFSN